MSEKTRGPKDAEHLARLCRLLGLRVSALGAVQEARTIVEVRFLDGHGALFPEEARAWDELVKRTESIADMAVHLVELEGVPAPVPPPDPEALSRRTAELVADLVEPVKADALEKLGEGQRALGIATDWLRARIGPLEQAPAESAS
jgi:hypothetical protein